MQNLDEVVERMTQGDRGAFEALVDHFQPSVFRLAHRVTGNREDALEVVQDVFLAVHRRSEELRDRSRFKPWLYRMAYCRAIDAVRGRPATQTLEDDRAVPGAGREGPDRSVETAALSSELHRAIQALPEHYREPLLLTTNGQLSYEQIAQETGCPVGTVRSRIFTARKLLRERLAAWLGSN